MNKEEGRRALQQKWAKYRNKAYIHSIYWESLDPRDMDFYMCEEWRADFEAYYQWAINNGWKPWAQLRRKQINLPHSPENSYWIYPKEKEE